jgi:gliding motility-associated-like protein
VTYHETLSDAQAGIFALASPYQNIIAVNQTVYARATYSPLNPPPFNTGCFRVVELELVAVPTPEVPLSLDPLVICDPEGDGFEIFDLTLQDAAVLGTQDPSEHTITYHESLFDAQAGTPFIGTPTAYQNLTNPQTIWVRLTNNSSACFAITSFELQTPQGPGVNQPTPLSVCDDLGEPNDGFTIFDLTVKNDEITGGVLGVGVQYFESLDDAQNNVNAIDPDTAYQNISNPQTVYVRVTDGNSGCVDTTVSLTLRVNANPEPGVPDALELCDITDPGDGTEVFDLTQAALQITGGSPWDLTYHESQQDALDAANAIVDPTMYSNTGNPQTIYVRVENNTIPEGCFEIVELQLIVNPLPQANTSITPLILCEVPSDGFGLFDLTEKIPEILNGQDPAIYQVSFYESQAEADGQLNPILNSTSYPNTTNPQTIWVGILNTDTNCYISDPDQTFEIEEREGAVASEPAPYVICDNLDANDGIGEFALDGSTDESQAVIDQILGGQDPTIYLLSFHPTLEDAQGNTNPLGSPFVNTINPQVIYARVGNSDTDCFDITEVILKVEELPEVSLEEFYRLCVDVNGNPIPEEEGALSPPVIDTGLDPSIYTFEWFIDGVIQLGQTNPSIVALRGGSYSVIVTEIDSECTAEASTTVTESSPPLVFDAQVVSPAFAGDHSIQATAEGLGEYIFQLDDGPFQSDGLFNNVDPGRHLVTIKDANGCGSVVVEVSIIDYPRFVTPNQDGYHDTWNIIGIAGGDPTAKIYIFDRFGKLLKQLSPLGEGWDGTFNGNPMPSSDYWFVVEYTEEEVRKEFKGHFTLKR